MTERISPMRRAVRRSGQRGFIMATSIFILVVLTVLAAAMVNVSTGQQLGFASDLLGTRAYLAARAGIEWGLYQVNSSDGFAPISPGTADPRHCPGTASFVPPAPTLAGITVTVTCTPFVDANGGPAVFQIDAVACNAPSAGNCPGTPGTNYVERRLRVTL